MLPSFRGFIELLTRLGPRICLSIRKQYRRPLSTRPTWTSHHYQSVLGLYRLMSEERAQFSHCHCWIVDSYYGLRSGKLVRKAPMRVQKSIKISNANDTFTDIDKFSLLVLLQWQPRRLLSAWWTFTLSWVQLPALAPQGVTSFADISTANTNPLIIYFPSVFPSVEAEATSPYEEWMDACGGVKKPLMEPTTAADGIKTFFSFRFHHARCHNLHRAISAPFVSSFRRGCCCGLLRRSKMIDESRRACVDPDRSLLSLLASEKPNWERNSCWPRFTHARRQQQKSFPIFQWFHLNFWA